jgi:trehalose-phosphatase
LLLLDFDGTLAPFRENRLQTGFYPGIRPLLGALAGGSKTRVVLVTGRSCKSLASLLNLNPPLEIWGSHGAERLFAHGGYQGPPPDSARAEGLRRAYRAARRGLPPDRVERKSVSVAVHWRGTPPGEKDRILRFLEDPWTALKDSYALELLPFDGGLEILASGFHKGRAVTCLLAETPPDQPAAYLGDDMTDERAFAALGSRGLSVLVRPAWRPTLARLWLGSPEETRGFLQKWLYFTATPPRRCIAS